MFNLFIWIRFVESLLPIHVRSLWKSCRFENHCWFKIFTKSMNNSSFYFRSRLGIFIPEARSFFKYAFSTRRSSISFSNCCSLVNFLSVFFFGFLDIDGRPFGLESPSFPLHCHTLYQERISEGSGISKCKAILLKESPVLNLYSMTSNL